MRGITYAWAKEHLEGGARILIRSNLEVDLDAAVGAAAVASRYGLTEEVTSGQAAIGQFEPARVDRSRDIDTEYMQLTRRVPGDELYTNTLLPERK